MQTKLNQKLFTKDIKNLKQQGFGLADLEILQLERWSVIPWKYTENLLIIIRECFKRADISILSDIFFLQNFE